MSAARDSGSHIWSPRFSTLFAVNFVIMFSQFMTLALVPKFAESLGASSITVGIVAGVFAVTALAVRPAVGWATLRVRHSYLLAGTVAMIAVAFVLYAVSTSIPLLIAGRLLHGAALGFLAPVTLAMASDTLPANRMAQGVGIFSLGQALSTAAGPSVGLLLVNLIGYHWTFLTGAKLLVLAAVASTRLSSSPPSADAARRFGWSSFLAVEALVPAMMLFFIGGAFSGINAFIILYGEARGVQEIGLFFVTYALFILISRPLAGRLGDAKGLTVVLVPGMAIFAISFVLISQVNTLVGFLVAGAVSALGYGICQPAAQTLALTSVERERRGVASNTLYVGLDLGYLIMPIVAGGIAAAGMDAGRSTADAYSLMYIALTVPVAIGLTVFLVSRRSLGHRGGAPRTDPDL